MSYRSHKLIFGDMTVYNDVLSVNEETVPTKLFIKKRWLETAEKDLGKEVNSMVYDIEQSDDEVKVTIKMMSDVLKKSDDKACKILYSSKSQQSSRYAYIRNSEELVNFFYNLPATRKSGKIGCRVLVNGSTLTFTNKKFGGS